MTLDTEGILVYDVATGRPLLSPLPAEFTADFTFIDATTVAVANAAQQRVQLWHLDPDRLHTEACRAAGRNLTRDEWTRLGPAEEPYRLTCPQFGEPPADPTLSVAQPPVTTETAPS